MGLRMAPALVFNLFGPRQWATGVGRVSWNPAAEMAPEVMPKANRAPCRQGGMECAGASCRLRASEEGSLSVVSEWLGLVSVV